MLRENYMIYFIIKRPYESVNICLDFGCGPQDDGSRYGLL